MRHEVKVNASWHGAHPMPGSPSREERVMWHYEHAEACGCRPVPESLAEDVRTIARKEVSRSL